MADSTYEEMRQLDGKGWGGGIDILLAARAGLPGAGGRDSWVGDVPEGVGAGLASSQHPREYLFHCTVHRDQ